MLLFTRWGGGAALSRGNRCQSRGFSCTSSESETAGIKATPHMKHPSSGYRPLLLIRVVVGRVRVTCPSGPTCSNQEEGTRMNRACSEDGRAGLCRHATAPPKPPIKASARFLLQERFHRPEYELKPSLTSLQL